MRRNARLRFVPVMLVFACFFGCGGEPGREVGSGDTKVNQAQAPGTTKVSSESRQESEDFEPYQAPEFADSVFHAELAEGKGEVLLDLSDASLGYGGISVKADSRVKIQITTDGAEDPKYQYDVPLDGTPLIFPLTSGSTHYTFFVGENVEGKRYAQLYLTELDVELKDEFQPFLRPSQYVNYNKNSKCVQKAAELAKKAETALDVVEAVYGYICDNVTYDTELATKVQQKTVTSYIPDLEQIMASGKGICFDYAALTAAMLRSQGIPTKMVFGDVSPDNVYHAWNMFYTEQTGWVSVQFSVEPGKWNRLDLTYSAGGADSQFVGDGGNYLDIYYY